MDEEAGAVLCVANFILPALAKAPRDDTTRLPLLPWPDENLGQSYSWLISALPALAKAPRSDTTRLPPLP